MDKECTARNQETLQNDEYRFGFGENWSHYLSLLSEERILRAEKSLKDFLGLETLQGLKFLDVGCGSGLFSLAAKRLGAHVYSFDYDQKSVACTQYLKSKFFKNDGNWVIEQGSALDKDYLKKFKGFDIVYSWGVLHHTGNMWQALENVAQLPAKNGYLFIALYNDQGRGSKLWAGIKRLYNKHNRFIKYLILSLCFLRLWGPRILIDFMTTGNPLKTWKEYKSQSRGMSAWYDLIDWVGGYPFEVSTPHEIFEFYYNKGYELIKLVTMGGGHGCNEFVFKRQSSL